MALQIFFGDDEHTAKDGPYSRILRARKWIYLSAAAATLLSLQLYNADKTAELLRMVSLPQSLIAPVIAAGLVYLLIQYVLLLVQLAVTYDITLTERLAFRRADDLSAAGERLHRAREELGLSERRRRDQLSSDFRLLEQNLAAAREVESLARTALASLTGMLSTDEELSNARNRLDAASADRIRTEQQVRDATETLNGRMADPDDQRSALRQSVVEAAYALDQLKRQNPADRPGYSLAERLIDLSRVGPPLVVGGLALYHLALVVFERAPV